ncbi:MAG: XdhC family protein [Anaerolineaceae bacterium]|nr:XdhC family protein [Anaerolineaceae bacterium]
MSSFFSAVAELEKNGEAGAICTIIESHGSTPRHEGSKMLVYSSGRFIGTVGGGEIESRVIKEALQSISDGKARMLHYSMSNPAAGDPGVCGGQVDVYVEPVVPQPLMVIIGGGHVGKAVVHLAHWLGFRVAVSDDRPEFCSPQSNPDADYFYLTPMAELPNVLKITPSTYLILTTRGVSVDVPGLPPLLGSAAGYIGVIGSKRRWSLTRKGLIEKGIAEEVVDKVRSPIGLELNAETPEEIAVSIMAEIIMLRNGGTGKVMS